MPWIKSTALVLNPASAVVSIRFRFFRVGYFSWRFFGRFRRPARTVEFLAMSYCASRQARYRLRLDVRMALVAIASIPVLPPCARKLLASRRIALALAVIGR